MRSFEQLVMNSLRANSSLVADDIKLALQQELRVSFCNLGLSASFIPFPWAFHAFRVL